MSETTIGALPRLGGVTLRRPRLLPMLGCIVLVCLLAIFFVWCRVQATSLDYRIASLEGSLRKARQATVDLRLEAATLGTPQRLEQVALNDLGLGRPVAKQVITVD